MSDLVVALGLVLVIEGVVYGGFPGLAKRLAVEVLNTSENTLRYAGIGAACIGVAIVWLARG